MEYRARGTRCKRRREKTKGGLARQSAVNNFWFKKRRKTQHTRDGRGSLKKRGKEKRREKKGEVNLKRDGRGGKKGKDRGTYIKGEVLPGSRFKGVFHCSHHVKPRKGLKTNTYRRPKKN